MFDVGVCELCEVYVSGDVFLSWVDEGVFVCLVLMVASEGSCFTSWCVVCAVGVSVVDGYGVWVF